MLSTEDRENILVLMSSEPDVEEASKEGEAPAEGQKFSDSPHMIEVMELLQEAHIRCLDYYPWTSGHSEASLFFAFLKLSGTAMTEIMTLDGRDAGIIDSYFEANRKGFGKREKPNAADKAALAAHLDAAGWPKDNTALYQLADNYLEMKMIREMLRRAFDAGEFGFMNRY